jgi:protein HOOK3
MQAQQEDIISERDEALSQVRNMRRETEGKRSEKADVHLRAELDRVRIEL